MKWISRTVERIAVLERFCSRRQGLGLAGKSRSCARLETETGCAPRQRVGWQKRRDVQSKGWNPLRPSWLCALFPSSGFLVLDCGRRGSSIPGAARCALPLLASGFRILTEFYRAKGKRA